jgi:hypothetical protein
MATTSSAKRLLPQHPALLRIADLTIALTGEDPRLAVPPEGAMKQFLVDHGEPDLRLQARWGKLEAASGGEPLFDSGGLWRLVAANGSLRFSFTSSALGALPYKVASVDRGFTAGEVWLHQPYFPSALPVNPLEYPLDELLLIHLLAAGRGVEVHACGVVAPNGQGYLFVGQSGAGKTTMARLWQKAKAGVGAGGDRILSDDRIILRKIDGTFWMYGTPWHGEAELACAARAPLAGIYLLRHGASNALIPQQRSQAIARLLASSFPPLYSRDALDFTLGLFDEVVRAVPCHELSFTPDERAVALVRSS